jgi:hypothetical protein
MGVRNKFVADNSALPAGGDGSLNKRIRAYLPSIVFITAGIVLIFYSIIASATHSHLAFLQPITILLFGLGGALRPKFQAAEEKKMQEQIYWSIVFFVLVAAIVASTLIDAYR